MCVFHFIINMAILDSYITGTKMSFFVHLLFLIFKILLVWCILWSVQQQFPRYSYISSQLPRKYTCFLNSCEHLSARWSKVKIICLILNQRPLFDFCCVKMVHIFTLYSALIFTGCRSAFDKMFFSLSSWKLCMFLQFSASSSLQQIHVPFRKEAQFLVGIIFSDMM